MAKESKSSVSIPAFHKMLVLAQWALGIFNEVSLENISATRISLGCWRSASTTIGHIKCSHSGRTAK